MLLWGQSTSTLQEVSPGLGLIWIVSMLEPNIKHECFPECWSIWHRIRFPTFLLLHTQKISFQSWISVPLLWRYNFSFFFFTRIAHSGLSPPPPLPPPHCHRHHHHCHHHHLIIFTIIMIICIMLCHITSLLLAASFLPSPVMDSCIANYQDDLFFLLYQA